MGLTAEIWQASQSELGRGGKKAAKRKNKKDNSTTRTRPPTLGLSANQAPAPIEAPVANFGGINRLYHYPMKEISHN